MIVFPMLKGSVLKKNKTRLFVCIDSQGKIETSIKNDKISTIEFPFLRGICFLFFGMFYFINSLFLSSCKEKYEKTILEVISKKLNVSNKLIYSLFLLLFVFFSGFLLLTILPNYIFVYLLGKSFNKYIIALFIGIYRLLLVSILLCIIKSVPYVSQLYKYNSEITKHLKESKNEKSVNFLNFSIICLIVSLFMVSFVVFDVNYFIKILFSFLIIVLNSSLIYEIFYLLSKNKFFIKLTSFFTNVKSTKTEKFLVEVLFYEGGFINDNMAELTEISKNNIQMSIVYNEVKEKLHLAGISDLAETDWLIATILNKNRNEIKLLKYISIEDYKKIQQATDKRVKRIPLSKIIGIQDFYGRDFVVNENVLSPRQDTELVVEEAIKTIKKENLKSILDLCTGSGAIAITINKETGIKTFASDISDLALKVAVENSKKLDADIKFIKSDLFNKIGKKFDMIISNPPYIPTKEIEKLDPEVKDNDPLISLDGGEDGLYFYKEIIRNSPKYLNKNGYIVLEIGYNQGTSIKKLLQNDFENIRIKKDYSKNDRIAIAKLKGK